ncbi:MAG: ABC transporter permease subunit [Bdellovibrionaceae bacterium]|nr:ABC transporter permease subunit [Pseudobdellovibrionaceae bacterium]
MRAIYTIALTTLRELIREKLFIVIFFLAIGLLFISVALSNLSIWEFQRILADLSLSSMEFTALGIALFSGSYMIYKEIEKQTCLLLLSKPISRRQFILGKFCGLSLLLLLTLLALTVLMNIILLEPEYILNSFMIMLNIYLKVLVILALVFLLSVYIRPVISLLFGFSFYLYSHGINSVEFLIKKTNDDNLIAIHKVLETISPQFFRFNWKNYYFLKDAPDMNSFVIMTSYFILWIVFLMIFAVRGFNKRDIV